MRTFHTGGVASAADITQGLPRVEELFEARIPKAKATIAEIDGKITKIADDKNGRFKIYIANDIETREHVTQYNAKLKVEKGDHVVAGQALTEGSISPKELLAVTDPTTVEQYILKEIQKVYKSQGVDVSDKHVETVVRRMITKVKVVDPGDTGLVEGVSVPLREFAEINKPVILNGGVPATGKPVMLGITKASLETDSFLSAASFQETTRILTDAATRGKVDMLNGLKENVILGKLIPAGTGAKQYNNIEVMLKNELLDDDAAEVLEEKFLTDDANEETVEGALQ
jgi:DNA-directed RNA polymerase subunit beta'